MEIIKMSGLYFSWCDCETLAN